MLYNTIFKDKEKIDYLFEAEPYNSDINIKEIAAIQDFYVQKGYIPKQYIPQFLNWLIYSARKNISDPVEDIMNSSFAGKCAIAQSFFDLLLKKMGFEHFAFNIGDVVGTSPIHALTAIKIPTMENGCNIDKYFMLDPTFRQFCISEENRYERYFEEPRWGVRMSTPHPGYFFNLTREGREFANGLIHYGYFEINNYSLKTYFDPFTLYVTPKESYERAEDVGLCSSTNANGIYYWNQIIENRQIPLRCYYGFDFTTPKEQVENDEKKLSNRIRNLFHKKELEEMFVVKDDYDSTNINIIIK